ncbi:synaptic vesicular amine transporter [Plakobranchus ocellatus]|uniref:Synaptic vesicular amine transporter n=1 Tax=Plakobranchus ocellatus TaxID=259542 RepID=A0AAV4BX19_9GAST|nr:synaptic vesicular amine transporter [Plakobranchus ocellatus]
MMGMFVLAISISLVPYCLDFYMLIGPLSLMGFGLAQVCTCMLPHIGSLVDHRHMPVYGSAYAITDNAFGLAFAVGPAISGPLIDTVGFAWTLRGVSVIILLFLPLVLLLRNPPGRARDAEEEETMLVTSESTEAAPNYSSTTSTRNTTSEQ